MSSGRSGKSISPPISTTRKPETGESTRRYVRLVGGPEAQIAGPDCLIRRRLLLDPQEIEHEGVLHGGLFQAPKPARDAAVAALPVKEDHLKYGGEQSGPSEK
jgi:hypothetical protein